MKHIEIMKSLWHIVPPPPFVPTKAFACICVHMFCTIYESGVLAQGGGGRTSMARKPVIDQIKMLCLSNKKEITEIKSSRTNFLKMIITWAIFCCIYMEMCSCFSIFLFLFIRKIIF